MGRPPRSGFTLIEVLVCLAVVSVLLGIGFSLARPTFDHRAATATRSLLLWARAEAIWRGAPVAVTELPLGAGFIARLLPAGTSDCDAGDAAGSMLLVDHPGVRITQGFGGRRGIVWLATGSGRSCSGGGVISSDLRLAGLTGASHVVISSLGRVRVEREP